MSAALPESGTPADELIEELRANRSDDLDWRRGRAFSLVYHPDDPGLERVLEEVSRLYLAENALNPMAFPSLARLERDVVSMALGLVNGAADGGGTLTSGGTESLFLAVRVARELARERGVDRPVVVTATSVHPAIAKAAHLLDVEHRTVPIGPDRRLDVDALAAALDELGDRAALVVASAPCYPFGVVDPVTEVAALAAARGIPCHVDACLGGFLLPFWEQIGEPVRPWDFRVPGVTSISMDVHKYGYSFKGASLLLFSRADLSWKTWWFSTDEWGGGIYGGPTSAGTRPAPPIAGAWAALTYLGAEGYRAKARTLRDSLQRLLTGVDAIPELSVTVPPDLTVVEIGSEQVDLEAVAAQLKTRGWHLDRQPGGLHLMLSPYHAHVLDDLLADLELAVRTGGTGPGEQPTYGAGDQQAQVH